MDLFLAISQGIGTSIATGVRTFLAPLLVGTFARLDLGVDFEGTQYEFLESIFWLALMLALIAAAWWLDRSQIPVPPAARGVASAALGGVLFAGCLAERDFTSEPGLLAGALCASIAFLAATLFLGRASDRLAARGETGAGATLSLMVDGVTLMVAALALLVEPVSYVALAFCLWVVVVRRRQAGEKYEGLRILR
jgi:hypothetical protein